MLNTTEEKLSALKAINEEKDLMEQHIERMSALENIHQGYINYMGDGPVRGFLVPDVLFRPFNILLNEYYTTRREQLIAMETELMK